MSGLEKFQRATGDDLLAAVRKAPLLLMPPRPCPISICQLEAAARQVPGALDLVAERLRLTRVYGRFEFFPACLHRPPCQAPAPGELEWLKRELPAIAPLVDGLVKGGAR